MNGGIIELDVHSMTVYQARTAIDAKLRRSAGAYRLRVIHGYHGGTALREYVAPCVIRKAPEGAAHRAGAQPRRDGSCAARMVMVKHGADKRFRKIGWILPAECYSITYRSIPHQTEERTLYKWA